MGKEVIKSGNAEIEKCKFHCYKNSIYLNDLNSDNMFTSKYTSSSEKVINGLSVTHTNIKLNRSV